MQLTNCQYTKTILINGGGEHRKSPLRRADSAGPSRALDGHVKKMTRSIMGAVDYAFSRGPAVEVRWIRPLSSSFFVMMSGRSGSSLCSRACSIRKACTPMSNT